MATPKNYWTDKQELLCKLWLSANTKQQFEIYADLTPALNIMIEIIMNRYFQIPQARQTEYKWECVSHVFCVLHKFEPDKQRAFSWLGHVIKNWLYEKIDWNKANVVYKKRIEFEYPEELPDNGIGIDYGETYNIDVHAFTERLSKVKKIWGKTIPKKQKTTGIYQRKYSKQKNILTILDLMEEYVKKYECFNGHAILEYIENNTGMKRFTIGNYFYELFGVTVRPKEDNYFTADERRGYSYLNDDICPNDGQALMRTRKRNHKNEYNYL